MRLYDTRRRQVAPIEPIIPGKLGIYTCGPTVYGPAHIGNLRTYILEDVLVRTLRYFGYEVNRVMNVTDVGHLVSDGDEGEDKLEIGARRDKTSAWEVAKRYEKCFLDDFDALHLVRPDRLVRATETVSAQIALIEKLEQSGCTYRLADGIYFDAATFPTYAELGRLDLAGQQAGARVEVVTGKRHPYDFALWKISAAGAKRDMEWESPWGTGFPGWHIECSAIALTEIGEEVDIHCGGVDHIPVHHTNEIAQSETATGKRFVRHWFHTDFLLMNGGKMSKSLGNLYTLEDLARRGIEPAAFKLLTYGAHYRSKQNFSWEAVETAQKNLLKLRGLFKVGGEDEGRGEEMLAFEEALSNDMNMPEAVAALWNIAQSDLNLKAKEEIVTKMDRVLALGLLQEELSELIPLPILEMSAKRDVARLNQKWDESDHFRQLIEASGYQILDSPSGVRVSKKR